MAEANYSVVQAMPMGVAIPAGDDYAVDWSPVAFVMIDNPQKLAGVIQDGQNGVWGTEPTEIVANRIRFLPYSRGAAGCTYSVRLYGWTKTVNIGQGNVEWVPVPLLEVACIAGDMLGAVGGTVDETYRFADTVTLTNGGLGATGEILSFGTGSGFPAAVIAELRGFQLRQFDFKTDGTCGANALWTIC